MPQTLPTEPVVVSVEDRRLATERLAKFVESVRQMEEFVYSVRESDRKDPPSPPAESSKP